MNFLTDLIRKSDRIVFHSFFFSKLLYGLLPVLAPKYGPKMAWLVWGGDLGDFYKMEQEDKSLNIRLRGALRKRIIYHLGYVFSPMNDYEFIQTNYKTKNLQGRYVYYSYPVIFRDKDLPQNHVMIGHSAHPSSQHIQTYEMLAQYALPEDCYVYSNLSYGFSEKKEQMSKEEYLAAVTQKGQELFGAQYLPDFEFCGYDVYMKKLMQIRVAVFNNNRGQAFSNIANMLHFGTKLYMNPQNDLVDYFRKLGAVIYSIDDLDQDYVLPMPEEDRQRNMKVIEKLFSDVEFRRIWCEAMDLPVA